MRKLPSMIAVVFLSAPVSAHAQTTVPDPRWAPWTGCWELVTESSRDQITIDTTPGRAARRDAQAPTPRVCVTPSGAGATMTTTIGGQQANEQTLVPDAVDRPVDEAGCRGRQRSEWSRDGLRIFARAEVTCSGDPSPRRVSGIALLAGDGAWIDVQSVEIDDRETLRVRRFRRADPAVRVTGARGAPLTADDVKEAAAKVSRRALEGAIVETNARFRLDAQTMLELDRAGVPDTVTDLMVALTYPNKFIVERSSRADRVSAPIMMTDDPFMLGWAFGYPMWSSMYGFYSPMYGRYSPYYYSPFAYSYLGSYDPRYLYGVGFLGSGGGSTGDAGEVQPSGAARAVDGLGYTRARRDSPPADSSVTITPVASASNSTASTGSGRGAAVAAQGYSAGGSSASSAGASSSGSSSSGDGGGGGARTAVDR